MLKPRQPPFPDDPMPAQGDERVAVAGMTCLFRALGFRACLFKTRRLQKRLKLSGSGSGDHAAESPKVPTFSEAT